MCLVLCPLNDSPAHLIWIVARHPRKPATVAAPTCYAQVQILFQLSPDARLELWAFAQVWILPARSRRMRLADVRKDGVVLYKSEAREMVYLVRTPFFYILDCLGADCLLGGLLGGLVSKDRWGLSKNRKVHGCGHIFGAAALLNAGSF